MKDTLIGKSALDYITKNYNEVINLAKAEKAPKENLVEFSMFISKARLDENGKMLWDATGSDTGLDSFKESMSVGLYKSFLKNIDGGVNLPVYLSLAHYSRLGGVGEGGVATDVFIDGNTLKAKGYFNDTPLGRSIYNAIRKDRRDNVPADNRVRISIGFYDKMHQHSNGVTWKFAPNKPCSQCALGIGGKTYLEGILEHFAVTRVPVNKRTDIIAKSESEVMTTRYEDALSIVGNPEIVDPIEKAAQDERKEKSNTSDGLVEKADNPAVTPAQGTSYGADLNVPDLAAIKEGNPKDATIDLLSGLPKEKLLQMFFKMEADGTILKDDLSALINQVLNETTDRSATVKGKKVMSDKPEKKPKKVVAGENADTKKLNDIAGHTELSDTKKVSEDVTPLETQKSDLVTKDDCDDDDDMYKPFGGATSFDEANNYIDAAKLEMNVYQAYSIFGALASNILSDDDSEIGDKLSAMQSLLTEFNDKLDPKELMKMSEAEKVTKGQTQPVNTITNDGTSTDDAAWQAFVGSNKFASQLGELLSLVRTLIERPASVAQAGTPIGPEPKGTWDGNSPIKAEPNSVVSTTDTQNTPGNRVGPEPKGVFDENSPMKSMVNDFEKGLATAVGKSGNDRLAAFQTVITQAAEQMKQVHMSLSEREPVAKSEGQSIENIENVVNRSLEEKLVPMQTTIAELVNVVKGLQVGKAVPQTPKVEIPQMKSIVNYTNPPVQKSKGMSVMDIATATTFGTQR